MNSRIAELLTRVANILELDGGDIESLEQICKEAQDILDKIIKRTTDGNENLCDICSRRKEFPQCSSNDVEFGNGIGNDNIVACPNYWTDGEITKRG